MLSKSDIEDQKGWPGLNFGGQAAVGLGLTMGSGKLFIEGGGNYGVVPIQKDAVNGTNKTGAGTVTLGYMFQL